MVTGIVGATGFIGKHLCKMVPDAIPITRKNIRDIKKCKTIFNVAGKMNGSMDDMLQSNFLLPRTILEETKADYFHAGSSVEYGTNYNAPDEGDEMSPSTEYGLTKVLASLLIRYHGNKGRRCCNLRLYCVYGEGDRQDSLISSVMLNGREGRLPSFHHPSLSRDFIHVSDVCRAFLLASENLREENYGEAFNIGTGKATSLNEIATIAKEVFNIQEKPVFKNTPYQIWYSTPAKARELLGFEAEVNIRSWMRGL